VVFACAPCCSAARWLNKCKSQSPVDLPAKPQATATGQRLPPAAPFPVLPSSLLSRMAQRPVLRGEVSARALRVLSKARLEIRSSAGVQGAIG